MNRWLRIFILVFCLFPFGKYALGQLSLGLPTLTGVQTGDVISLPVTCFSGFDSIVAIQFVVTWDTSVIKFLSTQDYNIPQLESADFVYDHANQLLRFVYVAPSNAEITLPDSTKLFSIRYRVTGPTNSGTTVEITESIPTYFEVTAANGNIYNISNTTIKNGFVPVGYNVSTSNPSKLPKGMVDIYPNPAIDQFYISSDLEQPTPAKLSIFTMDGVLLTTFAAKLDKNAPILVDCQTCQQNTLHYLLIQTDQWSLRKPIVFTRK
jgi:hypothetical protein